MCPSYDCHVRRGRKEIVTTFRCSLGHEYRPSADHTVRTGSPIGGIKEKVLGAHRAGANRVVLPWANRKGVEDDVSKEVRGRIQFVFARTVREGCCFWAGLVAVACAGGRASAC